MTRYYITVDAKDSGAQAKIDRMALRASDFSSVFETMATELAARNAINFKSRGSLVGGWQPLHPDTRRKKLKEWPGRQMMVRSGKLYRSVSKRPFDIERIGKLKMEVGTGVKYAKFHYHGTRYMPDRKYLTLNREFVMKYEPMIKRHIVGKIESAKKGLL